MNKRNLIEKLFLSMGDFAVTAERLNNVFCSYLIEMNNGSRVIISEDTREDYFDLVIYNSKQQKIFELLEGRIITNFNLIHTESLVVKYKEIHSYIGEVGRINKKLFIEVVSLFADFIKSNLLF